jgi:mRNA interferase MazF
MKQYDVWWAELPDPIGTRPVLLLSRNAAYEYLNRIIAVEITSRLRGIPQEVRLGAREGLPRQCVANLDNLRAVPTNTLRERAGRLLPRSIPEVKRALGYSLAWLELLGAGT